MTTDQRSRTSSERRSVEVEPHLKAPMGAIKRVPGEVPAVGRLEHESKVFSKEIQAMTVPQLQNVLAREAKILENTKLVQKLPDKGAKLKLRKEAVEALIEQRMRSLNEAADLLSALSLGGKSKNGAKIDCDEMEWKFGGGNLLRKLDPAREQTLDSDDESEDEEGSNPLKEIANVQIPIRKKNPLKEMEAENSTKGLLDELQKEASEPYACQLSSKVDQTKARTKFAPFKSVELNASKSKHVRPGLRRTEKPDRPIKNRQVEVMPLPSENYDRSAVKMVSLTDALELEKQQAAKMREIELKHAMERLGAAAGLHKMVEAKLTSDARMAYRDGPSYNADDEDPEEEEGISVHFTGTELDPDVEDDS